jgi:hypothetical protein
MHMSKVRSCACLLPLAVPLMLLCAAPLAVVLACRVEP